MTSLLQAPRVRQSCSGTGSSNLSLLAPFSSYQGFADAFPVGSMVTYVIEDGDGAKWEVGRGTLLSSSELSRDYVYSSSASSGYQNNENPQERTKINLSSNAHQVFGSIPPELMFFLDHEGKIANRSPLRQTICLPTIAAMVAEPVPTTNDAVICLGSASISDGLGGLFRWDAADATAADGIDTFRNANSATGLHKRVRLDPAPLLVFATMTALRAADAAALYKSGRRALVLGRSAAGDCPPFPVEWDPAANSSHDGAMTFRPTVGAASSGAGRWLRASNSPNQNFTSADATPSIAGGNYFTTAGSTAITDFDDAYEGQVFTVARGGSDIVITHNSSLIDLGGSNITLTSAQPTLLLQHVGGVHRLLSFPRAPASTVTGYGILDAPRQVATYAAMRLLSPDTSWGRVDILGKTAAGDQGAGPFWVDHADTTTADNAMTVLVCANGKRVKRQFGTVIKLIWHEAYVGNGFTDDSACLAAAMALWTPGTHIEFPGDGKQTVIGTGTTLPALNKNGSRFVTEQRGGGLTNVKQHQTLRVGEVGATCWASAIGGGFYWECPLDREAFELVQADAFEWEYGSRFVEAHQFAKLGRAEAQLNFTTGSGAYTIGETVTQGSATGVVTAWTGSLLTVRWTSADAFSTLAAVVGGTSATSRTPSTVVNASSTGRAANHSTIGQKWPTVTVSDASAFVVGENVTVGGTFRGRVRAKNGNLIYLDKTSPTAIAVSNTLVGATSGASSTVSAVYRPLHLFQAYHYTSDFKSDGVVECAYDGTSDNFHADTNKIGNLIDEIKISNYWGRGRRGFCNEGRRVGNIKFRGDWEGCLEMSVYLYAPAAGALSSAKGWSEVDIDISGSIVGHSSHAIAGVYCRSEDPSADCSNLKVRYQSKFGEGHGILLESSAGLIKGANIEFDGMLTPSVTGKRGVFIVDGDNKIQQLHVRHPSIRGEGSQPIDAGVRINGAPRGIIDPVMISGNVTAGLVYSGTVPTGLRLPQTKSGLPNEGLFLSPDFSFTGMATGAHTNTFTRAGGLTRWYANTDIWLCGLEAFFSGTPTADMGDVFVAVDGSTVTGVTNHGNTRQTAHWWPASAIFVAKGSYVEVGFSTLSGYASAGINAVINLTCLPGWNN